jgi:hypothetical protein
MVVSILKACGLQRDPGWGIIREKKKGGEGEGGGSACPLALTLSLSRTLILVLPLFSLLPRVLALLISRSTLALFPAVQV